MELAIKEFASGSSLRPRPAFERVHTRAALDRIERSVSWPGGVDLVFGAAAGAEDEPAPAGEPAQEPDAGWVATPGEFSVRSTVQEIIWEVRPFWEVVSLPLLSDKHRIALDLGPGVRYVWLDTHLDVKLRPVSPPARSSGASTRAPTRPTGSAWRACARS